MQQSNVSRIKVVLSAVIVGILAGGGSTRADFVMDAVPAENMTKSGKGESFSHDGLRLYLAPGGLPGGYGKRDIWVIERESLDAPWGEAVNLGPNINTEHGEGWPTISPDDLELYFGRDDGTNWYPMRSTRASKDDPWGPATEYDGVYPDDFSSNGLTKYTEALWPGGYGGSDIWVTTRATLNDEWGEPVNLGPNVNTASDQYGPSISSDGLALFFISITTQRRLHMCMRATTEDAWGPAVDVGSPVNGDWWVVWPEISPDGLTLYCNRGSGLGSTQVSIKPIIDLNRDGIVDAEDLLILVDYWGTDEPLCDIGPMPWGDGVVDVQDLTVLGEHLFEETGLFGSFTEDPTGVYTMTDRSADVWGSTDQFHFGYKTLTGPGTIVARIESMTNTHLWAKAGVMIRETLDANSKHAFVFVTPGKGVNFQGRSDTGGETTSYAQQTGITAPYWVRLEWDGQGNFTAAHSPDGSTWQSVGGAASMSISMNSDVHIGLALCSHNTAEMCEAVFTDVRITGTPDLEWTHTDIGFTFRRP